MNGAPYKAPLEKAKVLKSRNEITAGAEARRAFLWFKSLARLYVL